MKQTQFDIPNITQEELLEAHERLCNEARELMRRKNDDYAGASRVGALGNLAVCELLDLAPTSTGILTRMLDKMKRLCMFEKTGCFSVGEEGVKDTVLDNINYNVLYHLSKQAPPNLESETRKWPAAFGDAPQSWAVDGIHMHSTITRLNGGPDGSET